MKIARQQEHEKGDDIKDTVPMSPFTYIPQPYNPHQQSWRIPPIATEKYWCTQQLHFKVCALFCWNLRMGWFQLDAWLLAMAENKTTKRVNHHFATGRMWWDVCVCVWTWMTHGSNFLVHVLPLCMIFTRTNNWHIRGTNGQCWG